MSPIEFLHEWGIHRRGEVVDTLNPSDAEVLVMNGIARPAGGPVSPGAATTTVVTTTPVVGKPSRTPKATRRK